MRCFFSAGEASGDAYGAALVAAFRDEHLEFEFEGAGGRRMREAGVELIADCSRWAAMGIVRSLFVAPRALRGVLELRAALAKGQPGLFIPIDFGFVNVALARRAKELGWKVLYFVPPGSWRRDKQGSDLPSVTDAIVTPFPWSAEMLRASGANAFWFGHPLVQMLAPFARRSEERDGIAILPGSRRHEVQANLASIAAAVRGLDGPFRFAVAPGLDVEELRKRWELLGGPPAEFLARPAAVVLSKSRAAIVCSGTAVLESAICRCPCVVVYRGDKLMELEFRIRKPKFDFIALPNILLGRMAVPELIQYDANPERIRFELDAIVNGPRREEQLSAFEELGDLLGPADCLTRTAKLVPELCNV